MQQGIYIHSEWALPSRQGSHTTVGLDQCWQVQGTKQGTDSNPKVQNFVQIEFGFTFVQLTSWRNPNLD
jgi:hypothetical protein